MKESIYSVMARCRAEEKHVKACSEAISKKADEWMPRALEVVKKNEENAKGIKQGKYDIYAARAVKDLDTLRKIRDE